MNLVNDTYKDIDNKEEDVGEYLNDEGIDDYIRKDELETKMIDETDDTKIYDDDEKIDDYDSLGNEKQYSLRNKKQKKRLIADQNPDQNEDKKKDEPEIFFDCPKCKREFKTKVALRKHGNYCKQNKGTYKCMLCSETFDSNKELVYHKRIHKNEQCYFCNPCKLAFSDHCDYLIHNIIHLKGSRGHCKECGADIRKSFLKQHIQVHFERLHECEKCNKFYNGDENYEIHLKSHKTEFKCGECGKILKTIKYFKYHMATHTGYKPYQCLYCGMGFITRENRSRHMKLHANQEFKCEFCPYVGRMESALKRHLIQHTNEKNLQCDVCKKKFYYKAILRIHIKRMHEKKVFNCKKKSVPRLRRYTLQKEHPRALFR